jgi:hypothetical protein
MSGTEGAETGGGCGIEIHGEKLRPRIDCAAGAKGLRAAAHEAAVERRLIGYIAASSAARKSKR